jgi:hypothetical protein
LNDFRNRAIADRREDMAASFPETVVIGGLQNSWHSSAASVYRNWLQYLESRKTETPTFPLMARVAGARAAMTDGETA